MKAIEFEHIYKTYQTKAGAVEALKDITFSIEEGEIFGKFDKGLNGLSGPMFHQQVKMFITYIAESDSSKFKELVIQIQKGGSFKKSFSDIMATDIQGMWMQFISYIETSLMNYK